MEFGRLVSVHRGTLIAGGWLWYLGPILIASAVASWVERPNPLYPGAYGAIGAGACLFFGALCFVPAVLRWRQTVEVYEGGLVWNRLHGTVRVPREQVRRAEWVHRRGRSGVLFNQVEIDLANGKSYWIVGVNDPNRLSELVRAWLQTPPPQAAAQRSGLMASQGRPSNRWPQGGWKS